MRVTLQSESTDCALACLAMIASAHGYHADLAELRRRFPISLMGATLAQLIRHAEALGFAARPLRLELEELKDLAAPCILHWDLNHFVVLKRVKGERVVILDPAVGERVLPLAKVSKHFTGVALELTPTAEFKAADVRRRVRFRELTGRLRGLPVALSQLFVLALALEVFALAAPLFNQFVIDEVVVSGDRELLDVLLIGFALLLVTQTAIGVLRHWLMMRLALDVNYQWSASLFAHLVRLPAVEPTLPKGSRIPHQFAMTMAFASLGLAFNSAEAKDAENAFLKVLNSQAEISREGSTVSFNGFLNSANAARLVSELNASATEVLRVTSGGGEISAALDVAEEILASKIDVEVVDLCASSCANYIFAAGRQRRIVSGAVVLWHGGADQKDFREYRDCGRAVSSFSGRRREVDAESVEASRRSAERERKLYAAIGASSLITRAGQEPVFLGKNVTYSVKDMQRFGLDVVADDPDYGAPSFCARINRQRASLAVECLAVSPRILAYEHARLTLGEECRADGTLQIRSLRRRAAMAQPAQAVGLTTE